MRSDREEINKLRETGMSYKDISERMHIPRSTLSDWFKNEKWSMGIRDRLARQGTELNTARILALNKIRGQALVEIYAKARSEAAAEFASIRFDPVFIAGVMLYWGEGDKVSRNITRLINTDPQMVRLFAQFLRNCGVSSQNILAALTLYPDIQEPEALAYWSTETGIPIANFRKSMIIQGRHKTKKVTHGMCTVYVSSSYLKTKILVWIKLLSADLMRAG